MACTAAGAADQFSYSRTLGLPGETVLATLDYLAFFEMSSQAVPSSRDGILEKLQQERMIVGLCADQWDITNLGGLLFARKLADFQSLVRKAVRVIVYRGKDRTETTKEQLGVKGYASGFEGLISFVNDQLPSNEEIGAVFRNEVRVYPEIAVRELLANAIVHQDLSITGTGPTVEVFTDRVEITNPGSQCQLSKAAGDRRPELCHGVPDYCGCN